VECRYLIRVNFNTFISKHISQVLSTGYVEFAFLNVNLESCCSESFQHHLNVLLVGHSVLGVD
jgi:hypothetical protein